MGNLTWWRRKHLGVEIFWWRMGREASSCSVLADERRGGDGD
jgi:hypothetical protein